MKFLEKKQRFTAIAIGSTLIWTILTVLLYYVGIDQSISPTLDSYRFDTETSGEIPPNDTIQSGDDGFSSDALGDQKKGGIAGILSSLTFWIIPLHLLNSIFLIFIFWSYVNFARLQNQLLNKKGRHFQQLSLRSAKMIEDLKSHLVKKEQQIRKYEVKETQLKQKRDFASTFLDPVFDPKWQGINFPKSFEIPDDQTILIFCDSDDKILRTTHNRFFFDDQVKGRELSKVLKLDYDPNENSFVSNLYFKLSSTVSDKDIWFLVFQKALYNSLDTPELTMYVAFEATDLRQQENELRERVQEAVVIQQELKSFADKQLETNERLLIAESELKHLLDKEKESKAVLNQTIDMLKDTQGQLVHSEKMASLGQLTAGIAHEINNPINFIYNGIDNLKNTLDDVLQIMKTFEKLQDGEEASKVLYEVNELKYELSYDELLEDINETIVDIKTGAVRTSEIVKGLRVFSRLDEEESKDADINECLESTLVLVRNKTKDKIAIKKELNYELPIISCFPGQLNQVFMNIIMNAIQAIPESKEGLITVETNDDREHEIQIIIRDNGIGMSEDVKRRIFEPFYTTKPVGVGTGLGMSISYGIIAKHGGRIEVQSEVGEGTAFHIFLPKEHTAQLAIKN